LQVPHSDFNIVATELALRFVIEIPRISASQATTGFDV
jgi:hypothetical protein